MSAHRGERDRRGGASAAVAAACAVGLALVAAFGVGGRGDEAGPPAGPSRLELGPGPDTSAFARATEAREYRLPADHGPHFDYQTEWWYFTGNLTAPDGRRFGFQLTFFRRGLTPGFAPHGPGLATNQVFFAHLAITDVAAGTHRFTERWSRGAGGLAAAQGRPFAVWLEDWRVDASNADGSAMRLVAREGALQLALTLEASKPLVRHGDRGLSPKSGEPGEASHYIGYSRLSARGFLAVDGGAVPVSGDAWFDHEWGTSALGAGAVGWDWFSLQLEDGRELMYFQVRREDGSIEPVSGGTLVERGGETRRLSAAEVSLAVLDRWTSPESGVTYPSRWRLDIPHEDLGLVVEPWVPAQEMRTSFIYWEGAVRVSGRRAGRPVGGHGFVELTGYARSMQGVF